MKLQQQACTICILYVLVSQGFVHATLYIFDSLDFQLDNFKTRDATVNDVVMEGYIEYANPSDACSEISLPNFPQNFTMKKIVLINGTTTCNFITKVQNAKQVGYDIAVLFDPSPGLFQYDNITFPLPISEVNLSAVLVLLEDGIVIRDNYLYHIRDKDHFKLRIFPTAPTWKAYMTIVAAAIILLIIVFSFCVLIISFFKWIWKSCVELFGNRNEEQQNIEEDPVLRALFLNALLNVMNEENGVQRTEEQQRNALINIRRKFPSQVFSNAHTSAVCVICRYDLEVGEQFRELRCSHVYHTDCIDKWLVNSKETCPMCVARVNLENSYSDATESTRLLSSAQGLYSSTRTNDGSGPSNANDNPLLSTGESSELLAEARGSVNYVQLIESDDDEWFDFD